MTTPASRPELPLPVDPALPPRPPGPQGRAHAATPRGRMAAFGATLVRGFHAYARWLVGITWMRFALMSVLLLIMSGVLSSLPPFNWTLYERVEPSRVVVREPADSQRGAAGDRHSRYEVTIDDRGVRVRPIAPGSSAVSPKAAMPPAPPAPPEAPASPSAAPSAGAGSASAGESSAASSPGGALDLRLPESPDSEALMREIRSGVEEAVRESQDDDASGPSVEARAPRVVRVSLGDDLPGLAVVLILVSTIVKITTKGRLQAEVTAARAVEAAEDEALKRQVAEARMAAMQAQVEPHFLFNTLASIDHLIETDPSRASAMQKHLIALLRATMPTWRDAGIRGRGDLGRELALVRPYLEILRMRMEERLQAQIRVPDGLLSAEFPPMMVQGLVENAIKHGLEPKAEGGRLVVQAEIVDGDLAVAVEDTGLGFGRAATIGAGTGLANMRERLNLLYGDEASLTVTAPPGGGTRVTIRLPYRPVAGDRRTTT